MGPVLSALIGEGELALLRGQLTAGASMILDGFQKLARAATVVTIILGCSVVIGWVFDIAPLKSVLAGKVTMKMNTAVCFVLGGVSLGLQLEPGSARRRRHGRSAALLTAAVGLASLLEYVLGVGFGLDGLLIRDDPSEALSASPGRGDPHRDSAKSAGGGVRLELHRRRHEAQVRGAGT